MEVKMHRSGSDPGPGPKCSVPEANTPESNRALRRFLQSTFARKRGLTEAEAAEYIGMSTHYLEKARQHGAPANRTPGPRFVRIGRTVRYLIDDLDTWLESHRPHSV
jgi:hypothetical protein